jgi:hypothetical protein
MEEHRLRLFESRVLRRLFGTKRNEVTGGCRKLHNKNLHILYSMPSIIIIIIQEGCDGQDMQHEWGE